MWDPEAGVSSGASILSAAIPFGGTSTEYRLIDSCTYVYTYTLCTPFTRLVMKTVAEHSGSDLGSLANIYFQRI